MITNIIFDIPEEWLKEIASGVVKRIGGRLYKNGRIIAHLQETSAWQNVICSSLNPTSFLLNSGSLASSIAANIQLEQVKVMLSGLQMLSGATLAASIGGIGVSIAGFAMLNSKLNKLTEGLKVIDNELQEVRELLYSINVRHRTRDYSRLSSLLALGDEAWLRTDRDLVWRNISSILAEEDYYYRALFSGINNSPNIFFDEKYPLEFCVYALESLITIGTARFQCLILTNELDAARSYSENLFNWHSETFNSLSPIDIVDAKSAVESKRTNKRLDDVRNEMTRYAKPMISALRETHQNIGAQPELIDAMISRNIDGYDYLSLAKAERSRPIMILEAS